MSTWRAPALVVALLLAGAVGGYAAAATLAEPSTSGTAEPLAATSPSVPLGAAASVRPPPDAPPLATGLELREASIGTGPKRITFDVPVGWVRNVNAANEVKWKVRGNPDGTFVLRVEQVTSLDRTVGALQQALVEELRAREHDVRILGRTLDEAEASLEYTYVDDTDRLRHGFVRWLDVTGSGKAEAEVAVSGRPGDARGAAELVERVAGSMR